MNLGPSFVGYADSGGPLLTCDVARILPAGRVIVREAAFEPAHEKPHLRLSGRECRECTVGTRGQQLEESSCS